MITYCLRKVDWMLSKRAPTPFASPACAAVPPVSAAIRSSTRKPSFSTPTANSDPPTLTTEACATAADAADDESSPSENTTMLGCNVDSLKSAAERTMPS